jgi:hypothetical protein
MALLTALGIGLVNAQLTPHRDIFELVRGSSPLAVLYRDEQYRSLAEQFHRAVKSADLDIASPEQYPKLPYGQIHLCVFDKR